MAAGIDIVAQARDIHKHPAPGSFYWSMVAQLGVERRVIPDRALDPVGAGRTLSRQRERRHGGLCVRAIAISAATLLMFTTAAASRDDRTARDASCRPIEFEHSRFTLCVARRSTQTLSIVTEGSDNRPVRSFARLAERLRGRPIDFAFNAGMFGADGRPIGLSIVAGVEQTPLNRRSATGNFYMAPNGVFFGDARGWHLATTEAFAMRRHESLQFATQSGPMLLVGGVFNPHFTADGPSRNRRNGVGLDRDGSALFVISEDPVSFGRFARLFRDHLGCRDALYFDGAVSSLWDPASGRRDAHAALGPLIVAEPIQRAASGS
jgi:uncharacterized protein YigE (DUF2233 family)